MGKAQIHLLIKIFIQDIIKMVSQMDMDLIDGYLVPYTLVNLLLEWKMVTVNGKKMKKIRKVTNIRENIKMIKNMDKVLFNGKVEMFIKAPMKMI